MGVRQREKKPQEIDLHQIVRGNITGTYSYEVRIPKPARDILGIDERTQFRALVDVQKERIILEIVKQKTAKQKEEKPEVTVLTLKR